jgi:hypothetical protein
MDTSPIWFLARINEKSAGYLEAVPIGVDTVTGFVEYRVQIDEEVFVLSHNPDKGIWHLFYRAIEQSLYGQDDDEVESE